jgi:hypothetical protein
MRFPVKFNRTFWPKALTKALPSATDPRVLCNGKVDEITFASAVSTFKFGTTFKSTQKARFPLTILEIASLQYEKHPIVVDFGASDGSTSLDLMQAIPFEKYYVTDLNIEVFYEVSGGTTWFYDEKGTCLLRVTDKWVVYPETGGAVFPFDRLSRLLFACAPKWKSDAARIVLVNPALQVRKEINISIEKYNILENWPLEKADLIIAANILNQSYFTTSEIKQALNNLLAALDGSGRIAIIDNRPAEKATLFRFIDGIVTVEKRVNGGTDIENLVLNSFGANDTPSSLNKATEQV